MKELPKWVKKFNKNNAYLNKPWNTLYNIKTYKKTSEQNAFEGTLRGKKKPLFQRI